jgi:predicted permease
VNVVRPGRVDRDLEEEIRFHVEARIDEYKKAGMSADDARVQALRQFGNPLVLRESSRDARLLPRLESVLRDVGFGLRLCRRYKIVTAAAVISVSLAIGACAAGFSLVDALVLRALPIDDPGSLIRIALRAPADTRDALSFNYPLFRDLRDAGRSQVSLLALSDQRRQDATFDDSGQPEKVYGQWVSGDTFSVLGVTPALGRVLTSSDDVNPGQHPVAVLSHEFWTRRFGGSSDVLGRWVTIREKPLQIVGVAERGFTGVAPGIMTDLWAPTMMWDDRAIADSGTRWFQIWGRLRPAAAEEQARTVLQTVLTTFQREQAALRPEESPERLAQFLNTRLYLRPAATGASGLREEFERPLWMLVGIAALVLLIACANVASLLVARASSREREMALRVSIGAGRGRLVQQVLIESAMLAFASCALGAVLAMVAAPAIASMLSTSRNVVGLDLEMNWRLLMFLAGVGSLVTFLFGLAPALRASAVLPGDALKSRTGRHTSRIGVFRPLVAAQVAFSFVVLFVAGLCLTSFVKLLNTDLGFDQDNLVLARVATGPSSPDATGSPEIWQPLLERLQRVPDIESVSLSPWGLFEGPGRNKGVRVPGRAADAYMPWYLPVSPGFFATMRIPLVAGRDFEWRDAQQETPSAVIVNESFARHYFPGESPLGKRFFRVDGGATLAPQDIIGVARDAKYTSLREPAPPTVYDPYRPGPAAMVQIRTRLDLGALTATLRDELPRARGGFRLNDAILQSTFVNNTLVRDRAMALLSVFFSLVAIALVIVGLYGVLSYSVVQRTREIGIRLALGARPARVARFVLSEVGPMTVVGLVAGAAGATFAGRFITPLLADVRPADVWSVGAPLGCLLTGCALAALIPAVRAIRIRPAIALRNE